MDSSSVLGDDLSDYDIISESSQRSLDSSIADLAHVAGQTTLAFHEPPLLQAARDQFPTATLSAEDIQAYTRSALESLQPSRAPTAQASQISTYLKGRTVRVYVDGVFDKFGVSLALQLRQAKLSFTSVYLIVGVFSDELCRVHDTFTTVSHLERCEIIRHCRWVDEVVPDAPWQLDGLYLHRNRIDYVALEEGTTVDPECDKTRLKGYDKLKGLGKVIPTRRTKVLASTVPATPHPTLVPIPSASDDSPFAHEPETAPSPPVLAEKLEAGLVAEVE